MTERYCAEHDNWVCDVAPEAHAGRPSDGRSYIPTRDQLLAGLTRFLNDPSTDYLDALSYAEIIDGMLDRL